MSAEEVFAEEVNLNLYTINWLATCYDWTFQEKLISLKKRNKNW